MFSPSDGSCAADKTSAFGQLQRCVPTFRDSAEIQVCFSKSLLLLTPFLRAKSITQLPKADSIDMSLGFQSRFTNHQSANSASLLFTILNKHKKSGVWCFCLTRHYNETNCNDRHYHFQNKFRLLFMPSKQLFAQINMATWEDLLERNQYGILPVTFESPC